MNEKKFEEVLTGLRSGSVPEDFLEAATYADNALREQRRLMSAMTDCVFRLWNSYKLHKKMLAAYKARDEKRLLDNTDCLPFKAKDRAEIVRFLRLMAAEAAIAEEAGVRESENLKQRRSELLNQAANMIAGKI